MWPVIARIPLPFGVFGHHEMPIRAFGLTMVLALLAAHALWVRLARRERFPEAAINSFFLVVVVAIIAGARIFYVVTNWEHYRGDWQSIFAIHQGGMVFYGSFLGAALGLTLFARHYKLPILRFLDTCAAPTGLGLIIGRVGCLLVGDDYGKRCSPDFPLRIKFPTALEPGDLYGLEIPANNGNLAGPMQGEWLHPAQIYMSLNGLVLCLILTWMWSRRRFYGQLLATFCMLYAVNRSIIELFRGDEDRGFVGPLSTSQFVSIFVFAAGALIWATQRKRNRVAALAPS
jgi:phosphatidylglycerol---prolipoprotein diacylglyceryl transferase